MSTEHSLLARSSEEEFLHDHEQEARANVYTLLARVLACHPDEALLLQLRGIDDVDPEQGRIAMGWTLMKQAAMNADPCAIKEEYFKLFIGIGRGELLPFGSWYLTGSLMDKPVAGLRHDLQQLGIERQSGVTESEDHIAALCDAMALIIRHPDEIALKTQCAFFKQHLSPWAGKFFADMQQSAGAHFYRSVGFFGEGFIEFERQLLDMQS